MEDRDRRPQPIDVKAEDTCRFREERWGLMECGVGGAGCNVVLVLIGESRRNEGTGFAGRDEGSLERQDRKDLEKTREIGRAHV